MPATPARQASETPTVSYAGCGWKWARQNLPELSAQLLSKLQGAGLPVENARAEAYGENCFAADGSIVRFSALETDFYVTLTVTDLTDESALGNLLETTLAVIDQFPIGQTPGPQPGYIGITYRSGDLVQNLWFTRIQATAIRAQGLKGADLYRALKGTP